MPTFLLILIVLAIGATLFVLVKGVIGMAQGKDLTGVRSQALMRKRVMFQAVAIILIILFLMVAHGSRS
ncbi:MAG: twin transmembrane helix small protein [Sphingomonadales bacterium]